MQEEIPADKETKEKIGRLLLQKINTHKKLKLISVLKK